MGSAALRADRTPRPFPPRRPRPGGARRVPPRTDPTRHRHRHRPPGPGRLADALISAVTAAARTGETQFAVRAGTVTVPAWCAPTTRRRPPARHHRRLGDGTGVGTVLITGGTGVLGAHVARHLVHPSTAYGTCCSPAGADPTPPERNALREELTALGADTEIVACDAADRDDLARVLAGIPADTP
ncbi:KR domain-containing protein [Streptomyces sp. SHP22-7]|nr:KR domain-containing protein [Streptomyces sp. SHP22-7]